LNAAVKQGVSAGTVTVITVCYNSGATLARTLTSVAQQTWPSVEHIVIDGASTDGTQHVIEQFRPQLSHVVSEPDQGIYDAMNKGLALATGEVIAFLNADDLYADPDVLKQVMDTMRSERLDAIYGDVEFFGALDPQRTVRRYDSGRFSPARLGWGWMPAHPGLFVRHKLFRQFGNFRTDYRIAGDFEWIARVFKQVGLHHRHVPQVLVRMQTGGASTSGLAATIQMNREMLRACRANHIPSSWGRLLSRYPLKMLEFLRLRK
jgi:glycosyltransferase involved in cell wall biosynthesis